MPHPLKPTALCRGDQIAVLSLASPVEQDRLQKGCDELVTLGYAPKVDRGSVLARDGFFAGSLADRVAALRHSLDEPGTRAIFCARGGYGSTYLLDCFSEPPTKPKIVLGASDITSVEIFLWQTARWVSFYGPMVATNFDRGAGAAHGYDRASLLTALTETRQGWSLDLRCESLVSGDGEGVLLGGCLTLVESTLGTPWELDTAGAILVLEDRGMKPYQVDRALMHLKQADKLRYLAGIILGDFPECNAAAGSETIRDVACRILAPLGVPIAWGAPIGHTLRAMLTLPLGVQARLSTSSAGTLTILEPACVP
ncbi:MAG TPA: LD-carboxypeptidase [Candidatus Acidoferrales bacterium]|nr:LD-carboxypeptidase [Candidatus Acidoferrales bacterium]